MSDHISNLGNNDTLSNIDRMRKYISKNIPMPLLAKNLMRLNSFLQGLGEVPLLWEGMAAFKCIGLGFTVLASIIHKKQKKVNIHLLSPNFY